MPAAAKMVKLIQGQSWIRKMFEEGAKLKAELGADKVFDFSLGNPDLPAPPAFKRTLKELVDDPNLGHGYMPNPGWPQAREAVAAYLGREQGVQPPMSHVVMTTGAAGALNVALKALFDPGDELLILAPYFVEYATYVDNQGGRAVIVPTDENFRPDLAALEAAVTPKTRALLINSPNNPTGVVYTARELASLAEVLERASRRNNRRAYLISDEPYRKIVYDGLEVPSVLAACPHSLVLTSYSKDLSLAGERIGFLAVHPEAEDAGQIAEACVLANRILGFVNAPSLMQLAVARLQGVSVDVSAYARRRDLLCQGLAERGYKFAKPDGAFYLFPKSPLPDDVAFVNLLKEERILVVPGSGFGGPGHFRIAYCVPAETIENSLDGFERALKRV